MKTRIYFSTSQKNIYPDLKKILTHTHAYDKIKIT